MKQKEDKVKQIQEIKLLVGWEFVAVNIKIYLKSMTYASTDTHANKTQIRRNMEIIKAILIIIW